MRLQERLNRLEQRLKPADVGPRWVMVEVLHLSAEQKAAKIAQAEADNPGAKFIIVDCPDCDKGDEWIRERYPELYEGD